MGDIFNDFLVRPIINILVLIYQMLNFIHVPYALGFSIILLTVVIRFILYPLIHSQLKASKKMQELTPHLSKIKERHKNDAKMLQQETMRLYKEHGVNPAAGCLPMLVQIPIIWALYSVLQRIISLNNHSIVSEINKILYDIPFLKLSHPWDATFFGLPLGQNPSHLIKVMPLIILVPFLTGFFQFIQSKMMMKPIPKQIMQNQKKPAKQEEKKDDFASTFQTQSLYIFPVMIGFFSYSFPIGLSLYWNTFTVFGILQQYQIQGLGGLKDWIDKIKTTINK